MTVELIVIGKTDSKEIAALVEMYARRVNFYCKFAVTALPDVRNTRNLTVKQQRTAEGEAILRQTTDGDYVVPVSYTHLCLLRPGACGAEDGRRQQYRTFHACVLNIG